MGEMAEYYSDYWMDYEDEYPNYNYPSYKPFNPNKKCKYCGREGLVWKQHADVWRLVNPSSGRIHTCKKYKNEHMKTAFSSRTEAYRQCIKLIEDIFKNDKIAKNTWLEYVDEANLYATRKQFIRLLQALYTLT